MPLQVCSGPLRLWDGTAGVAAEGLTEAIAERLTISLETARNHIRIVCRERDCCTRLEAVATARRLGLVA